MKTKRIFSLLLCFVICLLTLASTLCITAETAKAEISLSAKKYSVSEQKYVLSSDFSLENSAEKTVYIPVLISTTSTVGGFGFTLSYDADVLEFDKEASFITIADSKGLLSAHSSDSRVTVLWETYSDSTYINGEFYYAAFKVKDSIKENATTSVSISVKQIYDGTDKQVNIIPKVTVNSVSVNIKVSVLTEAELAPFKALENIIYPDSLEDITAAKEAFGALSSVKKEQLKTDYPKLYEYYQTAQSRYNRLSEAAAEKAVEDELEAFLKKYEAVFKLTTDTVEISDKAQVKEANSAKDSLSSRALERLSKDKKELLKALLSAIEEKEEIAEEIKEFEATYGYLADLTENDIAADADSYLLMFDEGLMVYDTLSDGAKAQIPDWEKAVLKLKVIAQKYVDADAAAAATAEKVNAFQTKWLDVLLINSFNVTLGDETAIEIMLKDFNAQDKDVKAALSSRMQGFENLLDIIEEMKKVEEDLPQEKPEENSSSQSSSSDNAESNSQSSQQQSSSSESTSTSDTAQSGSDTSSQQTTIIQLPGETVVSTVTETVVEEKVNTVEKVSFMTKSSKWLIIGLIILLIISVISFLLPFVLGLIPKKEKKISEDEEIEENEEETE